MKLRYIVLHMDYESGYSDPLRDNFNLHSRFICNYLSVQVRKLKIKTDGSYNMISVVPSINAKEGCKIVGEKSLQIRVFFNKDQYIKMNELEQFEYYLQLLEKGFNTCNNYKPIQLGQLYDLNQKFRNNKYKNEWLHKKKKFKKEEIEISLNCFFSSNDFKLTMTILNLKNKEEIVSGTVVRTLPDEVYFDSLFKDVIIKQNELIITEYQDRPKFKFRLSEILKGNFTFSISDVGLKYEPLLISQSF